MSADDFDLDLSIGELVLEGIPHPRRALLERELRQELGRLLAAAPVHSAPDGPIELRRPVEVRLDTPGGGPEVSGQIGHRLAHVIHGALRRS